MIDKHPLISVINDHGILKVAEIGVLSGGTSKRLLENCPCITNLYMIDPWSQYVDIGQADTNDKRLLSYEQKKWEEIYRSACNVEKTFQKAKIIRSTSEKAIDSFEDGQLDMVIIDADHSYRSVIKDIVLWLPKLNDNGIISGHDYSSGWQDVVKAVNDVFGNEFIRLDSGYWYSKLSLERKQKFFGRAKDIFER